MRKHLEEPPFLTTRHGMSKNSELHMIGYY